MHYKGMFIVALALLSGTVAVCPKGFETAAEARVALVSDSEVYVAFGNRSDVFVSRSIDGGKSYLAPVKVASLDTLMLGMRRGPRIAISGRTIVVTAIGKVHPTTSDELLAFRSTDKGVTWSGPSTINDAPGSAREGLDDLASGGGRFVCAWLDDRSPGKRLVSSESTDGVHWSKNQMIYASPSGSICECCHPTVVVNDSGVASYLFRNKLVDGRDMYVARVGRPPVELGSDHWKIDGCPMDGGDSALLTTGKTFSIYRREDRVFGSYEGVPENLVGIGQQPVVVAGKSNLWFAMLRSRGGSLIFGSIGGQSNQTISQSADDPDLAVSPAGQKRMVLVWTEKDQGIKSLTIN